MKIEYTNRTYFCDGRPCRANRIKSMHPVECQRAVAAWYHESAVGILANPDAIPAAHMQAERMARKSALLSVSAALDEEKEVEWNARVLE